MSGMTSGTSSRNAERQADTDADPPTTQTMHRLYEELTHDVAAPGANGEPDADLAGALGDRDQHDVHHADTTDQISEMTAMAEMNSVIVLGRRGRSSRELCRCSSSVKSLVP